MEHNTDLTTHKAIAVMASPKMDIKEELSTCFHLDTALLKSSENVLSETKTFSKKMIETLFNS